MKFLQVDFRFKWYVCLKLGFNMGKIEISAYSQEEVSRIGFVLPPKENNRD